MSRARVLMLDAGSGKGGASRSLMYLARGLDHRRFSLHPILLAGNPLAADYAAAGDEAITLPDIPRFRPGERNNAIAFAHFGWRMRWFGQLTAAVRPLVEAGRTVLHCNHENLALTGYLLARRFRIPWLCHVRTTLVPSWSSRLTYGLIRKHCDHAVFISAPNRAHFEALAGPVGDSRCSVIHNPFERPDELGARLRLPPDSDGRLLAVMLATLTPNRGADRALEIAGWLADHGHSDIYFVICGSLPDASLGGGERAAFVRSLMDTVDKRRLTGHVHFAGHVSAPEAILSQAGALLKLGRENAAWGRDIVEALHFGVPVIALGTFDGFVRPGVTGYLEREFDAARIASHLLELSRDAGLRERMSRNCISVAEALFSPASTVAPIERIYDTLVSAAGTGSVVSLQRA